MRRTLTGAQVRAARAMLRMDQIALAEKSGVSVETVKRVEKFDSNIDATAATVNAIQEALEIEGITFTDDRGVELRNRYEARLIGTLSMTVMDAVGRHLEEAAQADPEFVWRGPQHHAKLLRDFLTNTKIMELVSEGYPHGLLNAVSERKRLKENAPAKPRLVKS